METFGTDANIQDLGETSTEKKLYMYIYILSSSKQKLFTSNRLRESRRGAGARKGGVMGWSRRGLSLEVSREHRLSQLMSYITKGKTKGSA